MADDVLKYRVKIFNILLPLQQCCQLHFFHLGTGRCLWDSFVLVFPTRLVARVLLVGKVIYFPSAVGLVPCMQGWLYPSWARGEVSWALQPPGSFVVVCVCFTSRCLQYIRAVRRAHNGISESPGSWQCFISDLGCRGESWGHVQLFSVT